MFIDGFDKRGRFIWSNKYARPSGAALLGKVAWEQADAGHEEDIRTKMTYTLVTHQSVPYQTSFGGHQVRGDFYYPPEDVVMLATVDLVDDRIEGLTPRERECCRYMTTSKTAQIAEIMGISRSTVETYRARISQKVGLSGAQLLAWCVQQFG